LEKQLNSARASPNAKTLPIADASDLIQLLHHSLEALRANQTIEAQLLALANMDSRTLNDAFSNEKVKKAFWINAYNVFNLYWMQKSAVSTLNDKRRHFFGKHIQIAGRQLSLNDIEHGILRRSKLWWAKGWLRNPFAKKTIKNWQLKADDPRIHFALNCGANGCPAIRWYTIDGVESELESATQAFFATEVAVVNGQLTLSAIFKMYIGDFGGRSGLRHWIQKYRPDLGEQALPMRFLPYDWTSNLDKFHME
jgi:hypothetical protein